MLISVCIPQYNRSKYLLVVLEPIRIQDHRDVEVIISDDCSTDDSLVAIPKYIAGVQDSTHVRFKYIRHRKISAYDGNSQSGVRCGTRRVLICLGKRRRAAG